MADKNINILIAGGKTGGHLFPGIAIAQALQAESPDIKILFAGIGTEFEIKIINNYNFKHAKLYAKPIKGGNPLNLIFSLSIIPISIIQALIIIKKFKPSMVIGTGGYSSFAIVAGAWLLGIKTGIQEQNTIPGLTNRMLSKIVNIIFLTFKNTKFLSDKKQSVCFGNPVRQVRRTNNISQITDMLDKQKFTILISGGSQGAESINKAMVQAVKLMENKNQFNIIHQTGKNDEKQIQEQYLNMGIKNIIVKAFFNNLGIYQDMADLIICRAGAGTISEITLKGLPSILIPYPYAADDHQTINAKELEKIGAAIIIQDQNLTGSILKQNIEGLAANREKIEKMSELSLSQAMPDADIKIAQTILNMIQTQGK